MHGPSITHCFFCAAGEKHRSQLFSLPTIKSNLLTSSITCVSERGAHLWKETKWLQVHNRPDGDVRSQLESYAESELIAEL